MAVHALPLLQAAAAIAAPSSAADIEAVLLAGLRERYPSVERWEIRAFNADGPIASGSASVAHLGARSAVRVGGHVYWYAVSGFQIAINAARPIQAGESLDARAGRPSEVDVMAAACEPLTDVSHLEGARARRAIRPDQVICDESVEPRPPVARGDSVTVHYVGARISLTTRGVAETDGALGEPVKVKKIDTSDVYRAVVSGVQEVTIHE